MSNLIFMRVTQSMIASTRKNLIQSCRRLHTYKSDAIFIVYSDANNILICKSFGIVCFIVVSLRVRGLKNCYF